MDQDIIEHGSHARIQHIRYIQNLISSFNEKIMSVNVLLKGDIVVGDYRVRIKNVTLMEGYKVVFLGIVEDAFCQTTGDRDYKGCVLIDDKKYDTFNLVVGDAYNRDGNIKGKYMFIEVYIPMDKLNSVDITSINDIVYLESGKDEITK